MLVAGVMKELHMPVKCVVLFIKKSDFQGVQRLTFVVSICPKAKAIVTECKNY